MLKNLAIFVAVCVNASALAFGWDKVEGIGKIGIKDVFLAKAEWMKDKDDKYDVNMNFTNEGDKPLLLFVGDMKCARGKDTSGTIDPHQDRRTIDLRGGESRTLVLTCRLATKDKGDFSISMKVFDNPSADSNTPGKVLAEKLVWKQGEKEGKIIK